MDTTKTISYPIYTKETGVLGSWADESRVSVHVDNEGKVCTISGNNEGLISLAQHLISLAQDGVPNGAHFHFDDSIDLERGSAEIIFERKDI